MKKRLVSLIIASLVISTATPAFAAETTESAVVAENEDSGDEGVSDEADVTETDDLMNADDAEEEHNWDSSFTVDKEAGCTEAGEESRHCLDDGCEERTDVTEIPALGHDYSAETTEDASCSKEGTITYTCSRCGDSYTESAKKTEHKWGSWTKAAGATVFKAEQQKRTCSTCGKTQTRSYGSKLKGTAKVTTSTLKLKKGQTTKKLKVSGMRSGDYVKKWKSSNKKIFTVSGSSKGKCTIKAKKKGTAKLTIYLASGIKKTVTVKVQSSNVQVSSIKGLPKKITLKYYYDKPYRRSDSYYTLTPSISPLTTRYKVTYSSSDSRKVKVDKNGKVTACDAGKYEPTDTEMETYTTHSTITVKCGNKTAKVKVEVDYVYDEYLYEEYTFCKEQSCGAVCSGEGDIEGWTEHCKRYHASNVQKDANGMGNGFMCCSGGYGNMGNSKVAVLHHDGTSQVIEPLTFSMGDFYTSKYIDEIKSTIKYGVGCTLSGAPYFVPSYTTANGIVIFNVYTVKITCNTCGENLEGKDLTKHYKKHGKDLSHGFTYYYDNEYYAYQEAKKKNIITCSVKQIGVLDYTKDSKNPEYREGDMGPWVSGYYNYLSTTKHVICKNCGMDITAAGIDTDSHVMAKVEYGGCPSLPDTSSTKKRYGNYELALDPTDHY